MNRTAYYEQIKQLAHQVRGTYDVTTSQISLSTIRAICRGESIHIDYWKPKLKRVRAAYCLVDGESCVLLNDRIKPKEPRIFALCHELKHHFADEELAQAGNFGCQDVSWEDDSPIEIGAEIFAAEFIFPENEFLSLVHDLSLDRNCCAEDVVRLKRASPAPVSYTFLRKRLQWFGFTEPGQFRDVQFQKLEEQIHGVPFYRVINPRRRLKASRKRVS